MLRAAYDYQDKPAGDEAEAQIPEITPITLDHVPAGHPVRRFADVYLPLVDGPLLPHADDMLRHPDLADLFGWAKLIEPVELNGSIDFKVIRQGNKLAEREGRTYRDRWMSDTVDPEYIRAMYTEITAASVLRKAMYSRGALPHRARSFLFVLCGTFPVFADNQARLQLFKIEAQPYVII